jgi:hypothetical protein
VNECFLAVPFFAAGTGRLADGDGLTKIVDSTALVSIGMSNFSGCCGGDEFSDSRIIFGSALSAGTSCRASARRDDFSFSVHR